MGYPLACPAYHRIGLKYEDALFSKFGGVSRVARPMKLPGKVSTFMNQDPRKVAAFVSDCLDYRRFEAPDLHPYVTSETLQELGLVEYKVDTFSSDYDDYVDAHAKSEGSQGSTPLIMEMIGGWGITWDDVLSWVWLSFSHWRSRLASLAVTGQTQVRFLVVTVLSVLTIEFASRYDRDTFL